MVMMTLNETFKLLEECAAKGERCPISSGPDATIKSEHVSALAKSGKIFVEISSKNWRRVTILVGPRKGKSTASNPTPNARTYQTIGTEGTKVNGKFVDHGAASRRQPSAPRLLEPLR
jgi:hypothetical protein